MPQNPCLDGLFYSTFLCSSGAPTLFLEEFRKDIWEHGDSPSLLPVSVPLCDVTLQLLPWTARASFSILNSGLALGLDSAIGIWSK